MDHRGTLYLKPVKRKEEVNGMHVVLVHPENKSIYAGQIIELTRDSNWLINTIRSGTICSEEYDMYQIRIKDETGDYLVEPKIWAGMIGLIDLPAEDIPFELQPLSFREGYYSGECRLCHAHFTAAKRQHICQSCCIEHAVAHLSEIKLERKTTKANENIITLVEQFLAENNLTLDFRSWYNQHGTNRTKNQRNKRSSDHYTV